MSLSGLQHILNVLFVAMYYFRHDKWLMDSCQLRALLHLIHKSFISKHALRDSSNDK